VRFFEFESLPPLITAQETFLREHRSRIGT
jgi:hypothetical protein